MKPMWSAPHAFSSPLRQREIHSSIFRDSERNKRVLAVGSRRTDLRHEGGGETARAKRPGMPALCRLDAPTARSGIECRASDELRSL